ncbi:hypothetical protein CTheo_8269 [Ceratobasidium theobromae]|uniref:Uncharacterized protein n=1 Tax=Ceratobasidium theobromae TaxID=1582974 RepID=A0A5N5Q950_9AGAM|nr:hypothetical protein CTheo_8269 [Ceratobasidium theobromae]
MTIKKLGDAIGITIEYKGKIADAAAASLGSLGPAAKAGVLIIGAYAVIGEVKTLTHLCRTKPVHAQTQLEMKRAEKAQAERDLARIPEMLSKIEAQPANLNEVIARLDQIANIWSLIQSSVKDISDILGGTMTGIFFSVLKNQVAILKANHDMLCEALRLYASKVADSGIPPT